MTAKKVTSTRGKHTIEALSWDAAGAPTWTIESEYSSHEKAKEAMDKIHKERKDLSLRIRHAEKTTASITTSSDASKLRKVSPEANANAAADGKPASKKTTPAKKTKAKPDAKANGKMSALDAAAKVLVDNKAPMNTKEMIEAMAAKGLWSSPGGKTPHATLYSAILRELATKGREARFKKTERGKFAAKA